MTNDRFRHSSKKLETNLYADQYVFYAGLESLSLTTGYDFKNAGVKGLTTCLMYTSFKQSDEGMVAGKNARDMDGADEIDLDVKYAFPGVLKGL